MRLFTILLLSVSVLTAADAPETDPDIIAAYEAGQVIIDRMKKAEAEVVELRLVVEDLKRQLAETDQAQDAAVQKALEDYKSLLAEVPFP